MKLKLIFIFFVAPILMYGQYQTKFYEKKSYWRDITQGVWVGLGESSKQVGEKFPVFIFPTFQVLLVPTHRLYISFEASILSKFKGQLDYKALNELNYHSIRFPYRGTFFEAGIGYYLRNFFINKGVYGVAFGVTYGLSDVGEVNLEELKSLKTDGQGLDVKKFGGNGSEIKPHLLLDRYFWIKNKQFAFQIAYSYPVYRTTEDHPYDYLQSYLFYKSSHNTVVFRLLCNVSPTIRYNPKKMSEL